jgi:uncharacterized damage-inducible protein DinB
LRAEGKLVVAPADIDVLRAALLDARTATMAWAHTLWPEALDDMVVVPSLPVHWTMSSWLWYLVEHELHHKAQISLYLHLCGIEAPFFAFALPPGARPDKRPFVPPAGSGIAT